MKKKGKVYLIGAGPGDPGLLTIKAKEVLQSCEVVVYDYLANPLFLEYVRDDAEAIYVGKKSSQHTMTQEEINRLLIDLGEKGKIVARLKGGDPFIFGRGGEEAQELRKRGIPFEVVPGITSAIAGPAYAGIPLSHRDFTSTIGIVTGHERPDKEKSSIDWEGLARSMGTLVFLMGVKNLPTICGKLIEGGKDPSTPAAMVQWGTTPRQRVVTGTLSTMPEEVQKAGIKPPAILVVGEVVTLRDSLSWFEQRPLFGKRVVVTRARAQSSEFRQKLEELGAEVVQFPTIKVQAPASWEEVDASIERLGGFDWVIFSSVNGVRFFFQRLFRKGKDARDLAGKSIATIGPKTAEALEGFGLKADLVPQDYKAEGLLDVFPKGGGKRVLFPRAKVAREVLPDELKARGYDVEVVPVYETVMEEPDLAVKEALFEGGVDLITFTASSTVHNFVKIMGGKGEVKKLPPTVKIASIGPITSRTLKDYGLPVHVEASLFTIDGLIQAILEEAFA